MDGPGRRNLSSPRFAATESPLHFPQLRPHFNLSIYLEAPDEVCFRRRQVRDITERQRSLEFIRWQYETTVLPATQQYVLPSKDFANLVLNTEADLATVEKSVYDAIVEKRNIPGGR